MRPTGPADHLPDMRFYTHSVPAPGRVISQALLCALAFALLVAPGEASAHAEQPRAIHIVFSPAMPDTAFVLTDGQGLFANPKGDFQWLCEDALSPTAGPRGLALDPMDTGRILAASTNGGFVSEDGGCNFARLDGPVGVHRLIGLWGHPLDPTLWTASATPMVANDLFYTADFGRTWAAAELDLSGLLRVFLRPAVDPDRIYLSHSDGLLRSDDGGDSFVELDLDQPAINRAEDFRLLAVHPDDGDVVFAAVENIRGTAIIRSADAGASWSQVGTIDDFGLAMIFDPATGEGLVGGPIAAPQRSADGGLTWVETDEDPLPRCLVVAPDGRLWGCRDPYFDDPWAIAHSADFGRSWDVAIQRYEVVDQRWDCPVDSRARRCCRGLCPGQRVPPEDCGEMPPPDDLIEMCTQPAEFELTPLDMGPDAAAPDAGPMPDMAEPADAGVAEVGVMPDVGEADGDPGDGCRATPGAPYPWSPLLLVIIMIRSRRRRPR